MTELRQNANWNESDHPRDSEGKFSEKGFNSSKNEKQIRSLKPFARTTGNRIYLPDEYIGKSVGAKVANLEITGPDGRKWHILPDTYIQNKEVIAGKGTSTKFRNAQLYADEFGGRADDWRKVKGKAIIENDDGTETMNAEIHWVEAEGYGRHDGKIKREL